MTRYTLLTALAAMIALHCATPAIGAVVTHLARAAELRSEGAAPEGVTLTTAGDHLRVQIAPAGDAAKVRTVRFILPRPVQLPADAPRAGIWFFVHQPTSLNGWWLTFLDAEGREFEYKLAGLESFQLGWQYFDTFPFTANELGRLHPDVGRHVGREALLPVGPMTLTGLRIEVKGSAKGDLLLGAIEADSYSLGSGAYHWGVTRPGQRYWMVNNLIRSGETPYLLAGQLLPEGGNAEVRWEVRDGFQGPVIRHGTERLNFAADDAMAQARRIEIGDLPAGNYDVVVSKRPLDLRNVTPTDWRPLKWRAEGESLWDDEVPHDGHRTLHGRKDSGEGYVGWRQMVKVPGPGRYTFRVAARGIGLPEARITPFDRQTSIGRTTALRFAPSEQWSVKEVEVDLPPEVDRVQLDVTAMDIGDAWFDGVSLKQGDKEWVLNGSGEQADVLSQTTLRLSVLSSPKGLAEPRGEPATVADVNGVIEIAPPVWAAEEGEKRWKITDAAGSVVASGAIDGRPIRWTVPAAGIYRYEATRGEGDLALDRQTLLLGGRTPADAIGPDTFARDQAPSEQDLFGPGKNYHTWAMYEYHPNEPNFFEECRQWIKDGRAAGFDLIRIRVDWEKVEPLPGVYDFAMTDRLVDEIIRQGGRVIIELRHEAPAWQDVAHQLDSRGRADLWRHGRIGRIASVWTPGMLDSIKRFTAATVKRYRNRPEVAGYHVWGLPGSLDWTTVDKPWWGQRADYSPVAVKAFNEWTSGKYPTPPMASEDWSRPDLSEGWRDWVAFRRHGLETFFIDSVLKPIRALDDKRSIVGYFGLDFQSRAMTRSAKELNWRRHTGGSELYYQIPLQSMRAVEDTGRTWPHEVHLMTPTPLGLEHATFQISPPGGAGFGWNFYWRHNIPVGQWTPEREAALKEWQAIWKPLWDEMRDAELAQKPDIAAVTTWSTMQYALRTFFALRMGDYATRTAAALYRDQLWPTWFSEDAPLDNLDRFKVIVIPPGSAQVMPAHMADALAKYVEQGGRLVLFPNSGQWVIEEPDNIDALRKRVGWQAPRPGGAGDMQAVDLGNSGLPAAGSDERRQVHIDARSTVLPAGQPLVLQQISDAPMPAGVSVVGRFESGKPAVVTWKHGRGDVVYFAGTPDWEKSPGLTAALYAWAGGSRDVGTNLPYVQMNHLRKADGVHYVIINRLNDSFRPQLPIPIPELDRARARSMMPPVPAKWHVRNLPATTRWRVVELSVDPADPVEYSAQELADGVTVDMYLMQTRVYRIEPVSAAATAGAGQ